jgi:hypothetical protein
MNSTDPNWNYVIKDMQKKEHLFHAVKLEKIYKTRPSLENMKNFRKGGCPINTQKEGSFQTEQNKKRIIRENHSLLKRIIGINERRDGTLTNIANIYQTKNKPRPHTTKREYVRADPKKVFDPKIEQSTLAEKKIGINQ